MKTQVPLTLIAALSLALPAVQASAQAVLPGYLTDSTSKGESPDRAAANRYSPPEHLRYPYVSTYYVKPTVTAGDSVKIRFFVTDFESSKIRYLDDSHRFSAFLEYRTKGGSSTVLSIHDLPSGDAEFNLGALPPGDYEMRIWAVDAQGRESHRVIHDFRVRAAADLAIPAGKTYTMVNADLQAYGIRNDGDLERVVFVAADGTRTIVKEKRADAPGYVVTLPLDSKTGKEPWQSFKKTKVVYDKGYDKAAVEDAALANVNGIQRLIDEKAAAGFRKIVLLPGTYRMSHGKSLSIPDGVTLDLGGAVLKQNGFAGAHAVMVRLSGVTDAHLAGGTLEGDYWEHNYAASPNNSEWVAGFELGGDCRHCSVENVKVAEITGYGGQNGISKDAPGGLSRFLESLPAFAPGGLDPKSGIVDTKDNFRFTTDFKDLSKILAAGHRRMQVSKYLGYQGVATRSWQVTVAWYDAERRFISAETAWQYREMWIPDGAAFVRVSVEDESAEAANSSGLCLTSMRHPVNCAVRNCRFERCRCVGYAASAMKNMLFEGNHFSASGESAACCAFDAEDGWDQMQDVYFLRNVFRDNPRNNSILTCAGHNFVFEENDGDIYLWGRTHSPCVRGNAIGRGTFHCDSRLRSGYGRFEGNTYSKGVDIGVNESKDRPDSWDYVLSGLAIDGVERSFAINVGKAGRAVGCTFRHLPVSIANAFECTFVDCADTSTYLPFPGGKWVAVTATDSAFSRFYQSNVWERCRFENVKFDKFNGGHLSANGCTFTGCTLFGLDSAAMEMSGCDFAGTTVRGNYWEKPASLAFRNCTIRTRGESPFLKLGIYTIGKIDFDSCSAAGGGSLVDVFDLRPISRPSNSGDADNPDLRTGTISLTATRWDGEAKTIVAIENRKAGVSPKAIVVASEGTQCPADVALTDRMPPTWTLSNAELPSTP